MDSGTYALALAAALLVGAIYGLINVRSPAPPVIALVGLLGILLGEQAVPVVTRWLSGQPVTAAWFKAECQRPVQGPLPNKHDEQNQQV